MATIIQLRNDTKENWKENNPVLAEGEVGIELDTNKMKVGDGNNSWNDLSYMVSGGGSGGTGSSNSDMTLGGIVSKYRVESNSVIDSDIMFTVNSSVSDIRNDLNDKFVVFSRNKYVNGQRRHYDRAREFKRISPLKATRMKDDRIMTSIYMKCWCISRDWTSPFDFDNDENLYFYTFEDTDDPSELRNIDPQIYGVNWSYDGICTCLNRLTNNGEFLSDYDSENDYGLFRLPEYDVHHIVNWNRGEYYDRGEHEFITIDENAFRYNDHFKKIHCHEYKDSNGIKRYFWSENWKRAGLGSEVYACEDNTKIPDKYSDLILTNYVTGSIPFEHVSERQDLKMLKYIDGDEHSLIDQMGNWMSEWSCDYTGTYFDDYPIRPIPLSKCYARVPVLTGDQEARPGSSVLDWVRADLVEDWQWDKLNEKDPIEFMLPIRAQHIAMRFFGFHKVTYHNFLRRKNLLKYFAAEDAGRSNMTGVLHNKPTSRDTYLGSEFIYISLESYEDINHNKLTKTPQLKRSIRIQVPNYNMHQSAGEPCSVFVDLV